MPEAAMNEDGDTVGRQHEIGPAGQVASLKTEAETARVQSLADRQFRSSVTSTDF
jgi:hypothetical protein